MLSFSLLRSGIRRRIISRGRKAVVAWCVAVAAGTGTLSLPRAAYARGPEQPLRILLGPLGFNTISNRYLLEGATMLTVNYVDNSHLLVTFGIAKLMKRLPDCPTDDEDRVVKAVLLELPTGKEIAETEWRLHDLGQYLWDLGGGTFMLRQRDVLTTFTPLEDRERGPAFEQHPFLKFDRRIAAIIVSANHDLLSIETMKRMPPKVEETLMTSVGAGQTANPAQPAGSPAPRQMGLLRRDPNEAKPEVAPVEISFVRLEHKRVDTDGPENGPDHIVAAIYGRIHTAKAVNIPLTTEGFLETKGTTRNGVLFDFLTFTGKVMELGDFATSCAPKPLFVSPSEFVAFGCRGSDDSLELGGFNLRGDLIWLTNFSDIYAYPAIVAAVPSGRFALSRTLTVSNIFGSETPSMDQLTGQEVRVVQMYNGKLLLKVMTSPIQRAGQNFALSPDGLALAIIHDNTTVKGPDAAHDTVHDPSIEVYKLPPLSAKDQKEVATEAALAPEPAHATMRFSMAEINAALARKPGAVESDQDADPQRNATMDGKIVGDSPAGSSHEASSSVSATGSIPASDPAPACTGLTDKDATGCPAQTKAQAKPEPADTPDAGGSDHPRKPPTLYAPGETSSPAPRASTAPPQ